MRPILEKAIEVGVKQLARQRLSAAEYAEFQRQIRMTKIAKIGDRTVFDVISDEAHGVADFATNGGFSAACDEVEEKKDAAVNRIWNALTR